MDAIDIKTLLEIGERITFECKKAEGQIPKSVWETYSSFANTIGGTNPLEAGKILYSLVDRGMLISSNKGRWTSYSINSDYNQGVKSRSKVKE